MSINYLGQTEQLNLLLYVHVETSLHIITTSYFTTVLHILGAIYKHVDIYHTATDYFSLWFLPPWIGRKTTLYIYIKMSIRLFWGTIRWCFNDVTTRSGRYGRQKGYWLLYWFDPLSLVTQAERPVIYIFHCSGIANSFVMSLISQKPSLCKESM